MKSNTKCKVCGKAFYARPLHISMGWGKYCSKKCQYIGFKTGKYFKCHICDKSAYRTLGKLSHSKSGKYFCSKSCQTVWRNKEFIGPLHKNWAGGFSTYRDLLSRVRPPKFCILCRGRDKRVLAVHHVDGNHKNNKVSNLTWICHNCHHLVHCDNVERQRLAEKLATS